MRHYEIVLIIHPNFGGKIVNIINNYTEIIISSGGKVHRVENWGDRQLAYSIKKLSKAYYVLMNIEVSLNVINELSNDFRFNEVILRNIIMKTKDAKIDPSPMMNKKEDSNKNCNVDEIYKTN
ncbi:30S ribosomal protein S6 [Candidatus Blochmanniella vafra str. BVAF]|uniref:Small ribosomal subunit protein bS6 n=1 Tax=Blochmanniella vafra (strain BVAF) TaxID=859654 RepID=E8Q6Q3_BLOVB|nr:30S ribosomal protein S6 [Candidatus Blochmannia vafer]ADV33494.1 30S ribosomal protein S6 [Candidatus Blochmannia vafer str. BVAF]